MPQATSFHTTAPEMKTDCMRVPKIGSLEELISELHNVFDQSTVNSVDVDYVRALMSAYKSNPSDWTQFAKFDELRYTRNLVDSGNGQFNLIALCWGEGQGSSIHDHSRAHCFMKILDGELRETSYAWPTVQSVTNGIDDQALPNGEVVPMVETGRTALLKDTVAYINDSIGLHRVENPSHSNKTVSLHLYSPPFNMCRTFDQRTGHQDVAQVTFYSKYGHRVDAEEVNECSIVTPVHTKKDEVIECSDVISDFTNIDNDITLNVGLNNEN